MANAAIDTGHGSTAALSSTTFVSNVTSISCGQAVIPDIDATFLSTPVYFREFKPGDLSDAGEVTLDYQFDPHATLPNPGTVETLTITFPSYGGTGTALLVGTGYIKSITRPTLNTDALQMGQMVFKWDGYTGPAWTAGGS